MPPEAGGVLTATSVSQAAVSELDDPETPELRTAEELKAESTMK